MQAAMVLAILAAWPVAAQEAAAPKLRVLLVTGGHDFDRPGFLAMWDSFEGIAYREVAHPHANEEYAPERAASYDVLVLYDMNEQISEAQKAQLLSLLQEGKGLVVLHHALADYQGWDEWEKVVGGRYHTAPYTQDGKQLPASTFGHDVDCRFRLADPEHPVLAGLADFTVHDEVYGGFSVLPTVHVLLTTDHPDSGPVVGWTNRYGRARVVYLAPGHDVGAYASPDYRRLVRQAAKWAAGKD